MLVELNIIAVEKANRTEATAKSVTRMLNYAATHSEAITRYHASDMILHIHSDASFISETGAKSRSGGYHYIRRASADPKRPPPKQTPLNGPYHVECTTIRNFLASEMEAGLVALFVNCQRGAATRMSLIDMGHAQPPTPEVTDSVKGDRFVNGNIR